MITFSFELQQSNIAKKCINRFPFTETLASTKLILRLNFLSVLNLPDDYKKVLIIHLDLLTSACSVPKSDSNEESRSLWRALL